MLKDARRSTLVTGVIVALALTGPLATQARGNFFLRGHEELTVATAHQTGVLCDWSRAHIVSGGEVNQVTTHDSSTVDIFGGSVFCIQALETSTVDMSSGSVHTLDAMGSSAVDISGGSLYVLSARYSSTVDISGGSVSNYLGAHESTTVTFYGRHFRLGPGLSLQGDRVLGTGDLSGEWFDGTSWVVSIYGNDGGATILVGPEPVPGDANWDFRVDYLDLGILATNYGQWGQPWEHGDFTGDSYVGYDDLGILATHYGEGCESKAIPEPATLSLLALAGLAVLRRRR